MDNNPSLIDAVFTPLDCVLHCDHVGNIIRDNKKKFLHKKSFHTYKGYAYSQMHKITNKTAEGKRVEIIEKYGYDVKFAYHVVRLLNESEQILTEGDLDLRKNCEQLKSIRRGEWPIAKIVEYFESKEKSLEELYNKSTLPHGPDEEAIKEILLNCLEAHYGSLSAAVPERNLRALKDIRKILDDNGI